jgi:hypothetical protein
MLTVILVAVVVLFVIPGFLLLIAKLLAGSGPGRSNRFIGFPVDPPKPPEG